MGCVLYIFHYANLRIHQRLCPFPAALITVYCTVYLLQMNLHTMNSLSNLAASAHKSNISLFYYYSRVSDIVFSVSCAKRIPIPVSLQPEKYQAWCSVHTKHHNPIQASELCITQAKGLAHFFQTNGFFLKKARLRAGKQVELCIRLCHGTGREQRPGQKIQKIILFNRMKSKTIPTGSSESCQRTCLLLIWTLQTPGSSPCPPPHCNLGTNKQASLCGHPADIRCPSPAALSDSPSQSPSLFCMGLGSC